MRWLIALAVTALTALPLQANEEREQDARDLAAAPQLSKAEMRADLLDRLFARLRLARSEREGKLAEEAIWKMWTASDSASAEALLQQATRAMAARENEAALSILSTLVALQPHFAEAWNKRATLYFLMGRFDESIGDIDKVLDLEPRHFGALAGLGMIKLRQGEVGAALSAYKRALSINPNMPGVRRALEEIDDKQRPI